MREIAQKGISSGLVAVHSRLKVVVSTSDNGFSLKEHLFKHTDSNQTAFRWSSCTGSCLNILQMPSLQGLNLQIKWPNDLYSAPRKMGGILVEPLPLIKRLLA